MKRILSFFITTAILLSVLSAACVGANAETRLFGDINNDGKINSSDYIALRLHILAVKKVSDADLVYADANADGKVNTNDYIAIRLHCLKIRLITQPTEEKYNMTVAYIPLDDRPVNVERVQFLAASAGINLLMPDASLFATRLDGQPKNSGGQLGDRKALLEWLRSVENTADVFVISLDQMLSGGLVGSRWFDNTDLTFEYGVADYIISLTKSKKVYLFDTVMRLASTVGFDGYGSEEYSELRRYAGIARQTYSGNALTVENIIKNYKYGQNGQRISTWLSESALDKYFASRARKLLLADYIYRNSGDSMFCYVGVDDSSPQITVQTNEISYITSILGKKGHLFVGTDELGLMCFAKLCTDTYGTPTVSVSYYGGGENQIADSFDIDTLDGSIRKHFNGLGLKTTESNNYDIKVLVLTRSISGSTEYNAGLLVAEYNRQAASGTPVIIIDASGSAATLAYRLLNVDDLSYILGYSCWNTVANSTGIALSNGISRFAFLKAGNSDTKTTKEGFVRSIVFSFCKDIGYKYRSKGVVDSYVQNLGGNINNFYSIITPSIESNINKAFKTDMTSPDNYSMKIIAALKNSGLLTDGFKKIGFPSVTLTNFRLPWYRTFEATFDIEF